MFIKKILLVFLVAIAASTILDAAAEKCECGDFASDITVYYISGSDCCQSIPSEQAVLQHYTETTPGTWIHTGNTTISGTSAQNRCCPPA